MEITDVDPASSFTSSNQQSVPSDVTSTILYSTKSPTSKSPTSPTFKKLLSEDSEMMIVRGLELELENAVMNGHGGGSEGGVLTSAHWPHLHDGIFVV